MGGLSLHEPSRFNETELTRWELNSLHVVLVCSMYSAQNLVDPARFENGLPALRYLLQVLMRGKLEASLLGGFDGLPPRRRPSKRNRSEMRARA